MRIQIQEVDIKSYEVENWDNLLSNLIAEYKNERCDEHGLLSTLFVSRDVNGKLFGLQYKVMLWRVF